MIYRNASDHTSNGCERNGGGTGFIRVEEGDGTRGETGGGL